MLGSWELEWPLRRGWVVCVEERGEEAESAVAEPASLASSRGICRLRAGRLAPPREALFVREGGWKPSGAEDMDVFRLLWVCDRGAGESDCLIALETAPLSTDCERLFEVAVSLRDSAFDVEDAQCWERIERLSSIGVNMLLCLTDILFTGSSICCTG